MKRALEAEDGAVAVEFALILPVLALLIAGLLDLGNAMELGTELDNAARIGAEYAISFPYDTDGITKAVQHATSDTTSVTLVSGYPKSYCTCSDSLATQLSNAICLGQSANPCSGSINYYIAVQVQESTSVRPLGSYWSLGVTASSFTGSATIETQFYQQP
jgi:Flp pilus assembly protein TadG